MLTQSLALSGGSWLPTCSRSVSRRHELPAHTGGILRSPVPRLVQVSLRMTCFEPFRNERIMFSPPKIVVESTQEAYNTQAVKDSKDT
jgi:hypothetical protein